MNENGPVSQELHPETHAAFLANACELFCFFRTPCAEHLQVPHGNLPVLEGRASADHLANVSAGGNRELPEQGICSQPIGLFLWKIYCVDVSHPFPAFQALCNAGFKRKNIYRCIAIKRANLRGKKVTSETSSRAVGVETDALISLKDEYFLTVRSLSWEKFVRPCERLGFSFSSPAKRGHVAVMCGEDNRSNTVCRRVCQTHRWLYGTMPKRSNCAFKSRCVPFVKRVCLSEGLCSVGCNGNPISPTAKTANFSIQLLSITGFSVALFVGTSNCC